MCVSVCWAMGACDMAHTAWRGRETGGRAGGTGNWGMGVWRQEGRRGRMTHAEVVTLSPLCTWTCQPLPPPCAHLSTQLAT